MRRNSSPYYKDASLLCVAAKTRLEFAITTYVCNMTRSVSSPLHRV